MDEKFGITLLETLIDNSLRILAAGFGVNWAESSFFDVVRLLQQEEFLKKHFLKRVRTTFAMSAPAQLESGAVPIELIELVAHELRWPELLELAQQRIDLIFGGDSVLAISDIAARLPEAYDDSWKDREFYQKYTQP